MKWYWPPKDEMVKQIEYNYIKNGRLRKVLKFELIPDKKPFDYDSPDLLEEVITD